MITSLDTWSVSINKYLWNKSKSYSSQVLPQGPDVVSSISGQHGFLFFSNSLYHLSLSTPLELDHI